jgi:hypothetical protein
VDKETHLVQNVKIRTANCGYQGRHCCFFRMRFGFLALPSAVRDPYWVAEGASRSNEPVGTAKSAECLYL